MSGTSATVPASPRSASEPPRGDGLRLESAPPALENQLEPISPELILVAPPDEASRARERLPAPDLDGDQARLARMARAAARASAPIEAAPAVVSRGRAWVRTGTAAALVGVAALFAGFFVGRESQDGLPSLASTTTTVAEPARSVPSTPSPARTVASPPPASTPRHRTTTTTPAAPTHRKPAAPAHPKPAPPATHPKTTTTAPAKPTTTTTRTPPAKPATPKHQAPKTPRRPTASFAPARVFSWPVTPNASAYHVTFWRDGKQVWDGRVTEPKVTMPRSFKFVAGDYRWKVVAIVGGQPSSAPLVDSHFTVAASATG
jgi:hypothetical protein